MREAVSVRLPRDLAKRLDELSELLDRPKSDIITRALREYLEEYEGYLTARHRMNDMNDRAVSENELVRLSR